MTDRGYGCLAIELAEALTANWRAHRDAARPSHTAAVSGSRRRAASGTAIAP
jgi:hypothetical protein